MKGFQYDDDIKSYSVRASIVDDIEHSLNALYDQNKIAGSISDQELSLLKNETLNQLRVTDWRIKDEYAEFTKIESAQTESEKINKIAEKNKQMLLLEMQSDLYLYFYQLNKLFEMVNSILKASQKFDYCYNNKTGQFQESLRNLPEGIKQIFAILYWLTKFVRNEIIEHRGQKPLQMILSPKENKAGFLHAGLTGNDSSIITEYEKEIVAILALHPNKPYITGLHSPLLQIDEIYPFITNEVYFTNGENIMASFIKKYGTGLMNTQKPLLLFRDLLRML